MLSDQVRRSLAEYIIYQAIDAVEYLSVVEGVSDQFPSATDEDFQEIHNLVLRADLDVTFEVDD